MSTPKKSDGQTKGLIAAAVITATATVVAGSFMLLRGESSSTQSPPNITINNSNNIATTQAGIVTAVKEIPVTVIVKETVVSPSTVIVPQTVPVIQTSVVEKSVEIVKEVTKIVEVTPREGESTISLLSLPGDWEGSIVKTNREKYPFKLQQLVQSDNEIKGTHESGPGPGSPGVHRGDIRISISGNTIAVTRTDNDSSYKAELIGSLSSDRQMMSGTWSDNYGQQGTWCVETVGNSPAKRPSRCPAA